MRRQIFEFPVQAQSAAVSQHDKHIPIDTEDMMNRQDSQIHLILRVSLIRRAKYVVNQVRLREHNAFASSRRSRCKEHHGALLRHCRRRNALSLIFLQNGIGTDRLFAMLQGDVTDHARAFINHALHEWVMLPVIKQDIDVRTVQTVCQFLHIQ